MLSRTLVAFARQDTQNITNRRKRLNNEKVVPPGALQISASKPLPARHQIRKKQDNRHKIWCFFHWPRNCLQIAANKAEKCNMQKTKLERHHIL